MNGKTVILGHTGFVGGALHRYLCQAGGQEVLGYSSRAIDLKFPDRVQALKKEADRQTVLVIASAVTRDRGDQIDDFDDNVAIVSHVAGFLERHPVKKCVYLSSISVYGDSKTDLVINEETPVNPDSYYALAKYTGELVLREAAKRGGFPLLVLRLCHIYGPGDTHATYGPMRFIRSIIEERKVYPFGAGEDLRDHLYIEDLNRLIGRLIAAPAAGTYNLVSGESRPFREIIDILREIVPYEFEVCPVNRKKPLIHQRFDIRKLTQTVSDFHFTDLKQGLRETFKGFSTSATGRLNQTPPAGG